MIPCARSKYLQHMGARSKKDWRSCIESPRAPGGMWRKLSPAPYFNKMPPSIEGSSAATREWRSVQIKNMLAGNFARGETDSGNLLCSFEGRGGGLRTAALVYADSGQRRRPLARKTGARDEKRMLAAVVWHLWRRVELTPHWSSW